MYPNDPISVLKEVALSDHWSALRVLIVDDDVFQRSVVSKLLQLLGISRLGAEGDGHAAEARLAEGWDLLILDLNMPEMDGIEFLNILAGLEEKPALILFSGEDQRLLEVAEDLARDLGVNVVGSISKPIDRDKMTRLLDRVEIKTAAVEQTFPVQDELSEAEIRDGILAGALRLVYQPKVDALTLDLVGAEALLRWETPDGRRLGPGAVIPVAERSDLMQSLTRAVFSMAMTQLRDWQQLGHRWKLSCNFSINDLMQPEVVADLERIISQAEAPADLVILEVTESKIAEDVSSVLSALTRLRLKGFGISIDDFGTGFSSMEQLRKFPFTELKIDRAFVAGAQQKPSARAIFESSVNLAKLLGISSVAEGAEDAEDLALCRELGVDLIQGYFIAKPMPPEEFLAWALKRGH